MPQFQSNGGASNRCLRFTKCSEASSMFHIQRPTTFVTEMSFGPWHNTWLCQKRVECGF